MRRAARPGCPRRGLRGRGVPSSSPRQTHYDFAHRLLAHDAHTDPSVFDRLEQQAQPYLATRWQQASGQPQLPPEVYAFPLVRVPLGAQNAEIGERVVRMPRPEQATEACYASFVRDSRKIAIVLIAAGGGGVHG